MRLQVLGSSLLVVGLCLPAALAGAPVLTSGVKNVKIENGTVVQVEAGELQVPESRRRPSERRITIPYYRLRSESPTSASPIFDFPRTVEMPAVAFRAPSNP